MTPANQIGFGITLACTFYFIGQILRYVASRPARSDHDIAPLMHPLVNTHFYGVVKTPDTTPNNADV